MDRLMKPSHMDRIADRLTARLTGHRAERGQSETGRGWHAETDGQTVRQIDRWFFNLRVKKGKNLAFTGRTNRLAGGHID